MIKRDRYLDRLKSLTGSRTIKIVTGIRRCGKSYLLFRIFKEYLLSVGINNDHILTYQLDDIDNIHLRDVSTLYYDIKNKVVDSDTYYILIDEIQLVDRFHEILNSLLHIDNCDVFVTGSNSKFLSRDIVTEFRGRSTEIRMRPLTFSEFAHGREEHPWKLLDEYMTYGGMPEVLQYKDAESKIDYLQSLVDVVYLRDIVERNNIQNDMELGLITDLLGSSVGSLTNTKKITDTLRIENRSAISDKTVKKYTEYLCDSFLFEEAKRYDVKGRKYFSFLSKYYIADVGLKNAREHFRQMDRPHLMENIIYNEMRFRGFDVDVGIMEITETVNGSRHRKHIEIDFVCNKGPERLYIQSAYSIDDPEKKNIEIRPFIKVNDSFKKIVIVRDDIPVWNDDNGIIYIGLIDFLMNPNSLK